MRLIRNILRVYSWIFETALSLIAIAVALLALLSHNAELRVGWLPWSGAGLIHWLLALGAIGLVCVALAMAGKLRFLLFVFGLTAFVLMTRGLFFTTYTFAGSAEAKRAMELLTAAFIAAVGAWPTDTRSTKR